MACPEVTPPTHRAPKVQCNLNPLDNVQGFLLRARFRHRISMGEGDVTMLLRGIAVLQTREARATFRTERTLRAPLLLFQPNARLSWAPALTDQTLLRSCA